MTQTSNTRLALARDGYECQWHKWVLGQEVHIFNHYALYHHSALAGGHHCFGRARVDTPETIIALCADCHGDIEVTGKIKKIEVVALLSKIVGVDLFHQYREFCKWTDEEWNQIFTPQETIIRGKII